jgi:hypothetical protein
MRQLSRQQRSILLHLYRLYQQEDPHERDRYGVFWGGTRDPGTAGVYLTHVATPRRSWAHPAPAPRGCQRHGGWLRAGDVTECPLPDDGRPPAACRSRRGAAVNTPF